MSFCQLHWFSQVLGKQLATWVLLPDGAKPPFATFYLLHGLSDDHTIWLRRTRIESYASGLPLIIVMPDGGRGFYTDANDGPKWATHMAMELPAIIERTFPAKTTRNGRCVGGLSMGGYGAIRLALGYPDRYFSVNSHSGALLAGSPQKAYQDNPERALIFGKSPKGSEHDLVFLAARAKKAGQLPKIRIDCGTEDFLVQDNRKFHAALSDMKIDHEYEEYPGAHNWDYWDVHVREALAFHAKAMKLKK
jgi:putative tributyrin esterase